MAPGGEEEVLGGVAHAALRELARQVDHRRPLHVLCGGEWEKQRVHVWLVA